MYHFGLVLAALLLPLRGGPWPQRVEIAPRWPGQLVYTASYHYSQRAWQFYTVTLVQEESWVLRRLAEAGYFSG